MLALQEFGITDPSSRFSLCEVSVAEGGIIKQRRLPDQLQNLAERIGLSSRSVGPKYKVWQSFFWGGSKKNFLGANAKLKKKKKKSRSFGPRIFCQI